MNLVAKKELKEMLKQMLVMMSVVAWISVLGLSTASCSGGANEPKSEVVYTYKIKVLSPNYCSDITSDTEIKISAPGLVSAAFSCWQADSKFGKDVQLGTIRLDENGEGEMVFPADDFPHGPLTIRILGSGNNKKDQCNLQVYNTGGQSWNEGVPASVPSVAEGMTLKFVDDFDSMPVISPDGSGATYAAHKPGGGDFGEIPFSDPSGASNPFSQQDTYLRIRANANLNTTGLISSLKHDGTGITATAPCYFECKFIAQNAIGTWPAFWIMTQGVHKGLDKPADEYDTIEAYGVEDLDHDNQDGYWIATHVWNQGDQDSYPGLYKHVNMRLLGGGASWFETFHAYGTLITEDYTAYYMDNIEVGRHETTPLAKTEPIFFFINNAVGGNGWPMDISRYNGIADMYVDWVRVFD